MKLKVKAKDHGQGRCFSQTDRSKRTMERCVVFANSAKRGYESVSSKTISKNKAVKIALKRHVTRSKKPNLSLFQPAVPILCIRLYAIGFNFLKTWKLQ